jgi:hypothetical protein
MKWQTLIVVVAITFSVLSPISVHLTIEYGQTSIGTFDVCHAGSLAVSSVHEMPCFIENLYVLIRPSSPARAEDLSLVSQLPIIAFQDERPPKA